MTKNLPQKTLRLVYAYEGDKIKLLSKSSVEMIPMTAFLESKKGDSRALGFFYELRNGADQVLLSQDMENPVREDIEVFSDDPKQSIYRMKMKEKKGAFVLLVPDISEAKSLVFLERKPVRIAEGLERTKEIVAKTGEIREIARFNLR